MSPAHTTRQGLFASMWPPAVGHGWPDFAGSVALAKSTGFGGINLNPDDPLVRDEPARARQMLADAGLRLGWAMPPVNLFKEDPAAFEDSVPRIEAWAKVCERMGCTRTYAHVMPGHEQHNFVTNWAFHVDRLKRIVDILSPRSVRFGIEFIGTEAMRRPPRHAFVYRLDQAVELADAVDPTGRHVGIALDSFHWYNSAGTLEQVRALRPEQVVCVHLNDSRADRTRAEQIDHERRMPGDTGVIDLPGLLAALKQIGCDAPIAVEPFSPARQELGALSIDEAMRITAASVNRFL